MTGGKGSMDIFATVLNFRFKSEFVKVSVNVILRTICQKLVNNIVFM